MKDYLPRVDGINSNDPNLLSATHRQLSVMGSLRSTDAKAHLLSKLLLLMRLELTSDLTLCFFISYLFVFLNAMSPYSEMISSLHLFGSNIFTAQKVSQRGFPSPCLVAVNHDSISIVHPQTQVEIFTVVDSL